MRVRVLVVVCLVVPLTACGSSGADGADAATSDVSRQDREDSASTVHTSPTSAPPTPSSDPTATSAPVGTAAPTTTAAVGARAVVAYGAEPSQFGELWLPDTSGLRPVVVLVHGGFWRESYGLDLMDDLAIDLVAGGRAVWNVEYRRVGEPGGGWPGTFDDVASAVDHLAVLSEDHPLDLARVAIVGHSAGGHLALWAAGRATLPAGAPGADPVVTPAVAVGQAPVVDLAGAATDGVGLGAIDALLGGTAAEVPDRYAIATPALVDDVPTVIVRGGDDTAVPNRFSLPPPSTEVADTVDVVDIGGADHFDLIDPDHEAWAAVVERLPAR